MMSMTLTQKALNGQMSGSRPKNPLRVILRFR